MAEVRLQGVTKYYDDVLAVQGVDLEIKDKEFLVLVGPSGCGKSTTLRMVAGLEEISGGDLFIDGRRVNDVPPKDRDIAMVFQNYALYPHMTVFDNMSFSLKLRKIPKAEIKQRVEHAARILSIESLLARKPKQLSGGQRQRVAMGRAIVRDPSVFLFDEPLSNLDAKLRVQMRVELSRLHQQLGTTIIYVTHDQVEAMTLADRIVVMKDGVVQQVGTPMELFHQPVNAFVGGFIGSPSMNFLKASVTHKEGVAVLEGDGFSLPLNAALTGQIGDRSEVLMGIRPQHLSPEIKSATYLESTVQVIEPMGGETFYYFQIGESQAVARSEGDQSVNRGQVGRFGIDLEHLHLFDAEGTHRLDTKE